MKRIVIAAIITTFFGIALSVNSPLTAASFIAQFNAKCGSDVNQFCQGVKQGDGRIFSCLRNNRESISKECDDYLSGLLRSAMTSFISFRRNCGDDYQKFCQDVERGEGRVIRCLWTREGELSASCRQQIQPFRPLEY